MDKSLLSDVSRRSDYSFFGVRFFKTRSGGMIHIMDRGFCCCNNFGSIEEFVDYPVLVHYENWKTGRFVIDQQLYQELLDQKSLTIYDDDTFLFEDFNIRLCKICRFTMENRLTKNLQQSECGYIFRNQYRSLNGSDDIVRMLSRHFGIDNPYDSDESKDITTSYKKLYQDYKVEPVYNCQFVIKKQKSWKYDPRTYQKIPTIKLTKCKNKGRSKNKYCTKHMNIYIKPMIEAGLPKVISHVIIDFL